MFEFVNLHVLSLHALDTDGYFCQFSDSFSQKFPSFHTFVCSLKCYAAMFMYFDLEATRGAVKILIGPLISVIFVSSKIFFFLNIMFCITGTQIL